MDRRVATANVTDITLEVLYVDGIETDNSLRGSVRSMVGKSTNVAYREQSDIRFCHVLTMVIRSWRLGKLFFHFVERLKKLLHSCLVRFLGAAQQLVLLQYVLQMHYERGKTALINT